MSTPTRPLFNSGRESPFKRQNSTAVRGSTPTREASSSTSLRASTPTRDTPSATLHRPSSSLSHSVSPTKNGSLSPEKASPFVRRPSQNSPVTASRPSSPFARSNSVLGLPSSPSRSPSRASSGYDGEKRGSFSLAREASSNSMSFSRQNSLAPESTPEPEASPTPTDRTVEPAKTAIDLPPRSLPSAPESPSPYDGARASPAPAPATLDSPFDGARSSSRTNLFESPTATRPASQLNLRPTAQRTVTSSTTTTLRQPTFAPSNTNPATTTSTPSTRKPPAPTTRTHPPTSLPAPLLHSLRESFEVLDTTSTNTLTPHSLQTALASSGLDPATLPPPSAFFPPGTPQTLSLSTYLTALSTPLAAFSSPSELAAAFAAFDLEDSGEVDAEVLREALMGTGPEAGEEDCRFSAEEAEAVLAGFVGRRAFTAAKGLGSPRKNGGRGEVFRWREFVSAVGGNEGGAGAGAAVAA